jgi:hypothetical protein
LDGRVIDEWKTGRKVTVGHVRPCRVMAWFCDGS